LLDGTFTKSAAHEVHCAIHAAVAKATDKDRVQADGRPWTAFQRLWMDLAGQTKLTSVTLNYDTLIEQALNSGPDAQGFSRIDGEDLWQFDDRPSGRTPTVMHLHGSIHLGYRRSVLDPDPLRWRYTHKDLFLVFRSRAGLLELGFDRPREPYAGRTHRNRRSNHHGTSENRTSSSSSHTRHTIVDSVGSSRRFLACSSSGTGSMTRTSINCSTECDADTAMRYGSPSSPNSIPSKCMECMDHGR